MDFPIDFWVVLNLFHQSFVSFITNFKFDKDYLRTHICIIGWCLCAKEIHRLTPMDLKTYTLAKNPRL